MVISSSWKGNGSYKPQIYYILINILTQNGMEVLGDTPYIKPEILNGSPKTTNIKDILSVKLKHGTGRAAEIQKWISEHEVDNFVILDDEDYDWANYGYKNNWIRPTWFGNGGLKKEHVNKAIEILNKEAY